MKQFVPITDELLYQCSESTPIALVPFSPDYSCHHWMKEGFEPEFEILDENDQVLREL